MTISNVSPHFTPEFYERSVGACPVMRFFFAGVQDPGSTFPTLGQDGNEFCVLDVSRTCQDLFSQMNADDACCPRDGSVEESRLLWEGAVRRQKLSEAFFEKYKRLNASEPAAVDLAAISDAWKNVAGKQVEPLGHQERLLPAANVGRLMSRQLENSMKLSKETRSFMQEVLSEFICFLTSEVTSCGSRIVTGHEYCIASERLDLGPIGRVCNVMRPKLMPPPRKRKKDGTPHPADVAMMPEFQAAGSRSPQVHFGPGVLAQPLEYLPLEDCGRSRTVHLSDLSANGVAEPCLTLSTASTSATSNIVSLSVQIGKKSNQNGNRNLIPLLSARDDGKEPSKFVNAIGIAGAGVPDQPYSASCQNHNLGNSNHDDGISLEILMQGLEEEHAEHGRKQVELERFFDESNKAACVHPLRSAHSHDGVVDANSAAPLATSMRATTSVEADFCCQRAVSTFRARSSPAHAQAEAQVAAMLAVAQAAKATKAARDNLQRIRSTTTS